MAVISQSLIKCCEKCLVLPDQGLWGNSSLKTNYNPSKYDITINLVSFIVSCRNCLAGFVNVVLQTKKQKIAFSFVQLKVYSLYFVLAFVSCIKLC